jgi:ABC-2 type transport system permease protein
MKKYLRIYLVLIRLNFAALIAYRAHFINSLIGTLGWSIVSVATMLLLTSKTKTVAGWSQNELLAATGMYSIIIGAFGTLFTRNFERFSRIIHLGQLDGILTKPADSQFLLSCTIVNFASLARIVLGILYTAYILTKMNATVTPSSLALFILFAFCGLILLYAIWFLALTITVWFTNLSNIIDFLYNFNNLSRYPPEVIQQTKNLFLLVLLPLTLIATVPVKALIAKATLTNELLLLCFATLLFFLARKFWHFALRHYTSASG